MIIGSLFMAARVYRSRSDSFSPSGFVTGLPFARPTDIWCGGSVVHDIKHSQAAMTEIHLMSICYLMIGVALFVARLALEYLSGVADNSHFLNW
ncbi:hypothetical protein LINGRAHAP2_LOCUS14821 [Linum grandiflorum]